MVVCSNPVHDSDRPPYGSNEIPPRPGYVPGLSPGHGPVPPSPGYAPVPLRAGYGPVPPSPGYVPCPSPGYAPGPSPGYAPEPSSGYAPVHPSPGYAPEEAVGGYEMLAMIPEEPTTPGTPSYAWSGIAVTAVPGSRVSDSSGSEPTSLIREVRNTIAEGCDRM
ncbi:hypothetical protein R1sor_025056 [Riccia sorocarpa]|uniref:Uncharacterized protein n=1 Tax=Riccia sorocarpa TaxID=122646 RepID=A0ABD3G7I6_9MARC